MSKEKENTGEKAKLSAGIKNTAYLVRYVRQHVPALFYTNIMTGILWGYLNIASSVLVIKVVFDMLGEGRPFTDVCKFLLMMSVILLFALGVIYFCEKRLWPVQKLKLGKSLHAELFLKAQKADLRCYDDTKFYTDFIWTVQKAEEEVYTAVGNLGSVLLHVLACIGVIAVMLEVDPFLLVLTAASMACQFVFRLLKTKMNFYRELSLRPLVKKYEYISRVFYMPDYAKELRMSRVDRLLTEEFDGCISKMDAVYKKLQFRLTALETGEQICNVFLTNMLLIFVLVYKIFIVGSVSIGDLSVSIAAVGKLNSMYSGLLESLSQFVQSGMFADKLRTFLDIEQTVASPENPASLPIVPGDIEFRDVSFRYGDGGWVLRHINMKIKAQTKAAVVGYNGAGKSTLVKLLMRFYDVNSGEIRVSGTPIDEMTRKSLRSNYGMVLQETWLRSGTIRENITMGKPDATEEEIIAAAKASHAHSFIKRLPKGYDTVISEDGGSLSQGQKQLLCITRVMLCLPPMLILDEATSSIDTRTEIKIQEAFARMMKGRTSFIVAHRLSTIREADIILVMRDGNIVEQGKHEELLEKNGFYAKLYNSQFAK